MAFNFKTFAAVGALIGSLALVGCGQDEKDPNHIKVGVIVGAEQQVAEVAHQYAGEASFAFFIMGEQSGEICQLFLTAMLEKIQI